jgi:hypothetical protein
MWRRTASPPSNRRASAFYAARHAWASGAPRPTLAVDHTRDRCPAGRTDPRHTPSEARARPAAALPVGVPLLPRMRVRPGRSFIGLYGLPTGFSNVKICDIGHFWPKPLFRGTSRRGRASSPGSYTSRPPPTGLRARSTNLSIRSNSWSAFRTRSSSPTSATTVGGQSCAVNGPAVESRHSLATANQCSSRDDAHPGHGRNTRNGSPGDADWRPSSLAATGVG